MPSDHASPPLPVSFRCLGCDGFSRAEPYPNKLADRLRASLGALALPILCRHVTGFFVVEEEEIVQALQFAYERPKLVVSSRVRCVGSVAQTKTSTCRRAGGRGVYWRVCNVGVSMAMSGRGRVYVVMGWLAGCVREGLQPPYQLSCMREFFRGEWGSAKSTLMVEGGHVSYHGSGGGPFLFN